MHATNNQFLDKFNDEGRLFSWGGGGDFVYIAFVQRVICQIIENICVSLLFCTNNYVLQMLGITTVLLNVQVFNDGEH